MRYHLQRSPAPPALDPAPDPRDEDLEGDLRWIRRYLARVHTDAWQEKYNLRRETTDLDGRPTSEWFLTPMPKAVRPLEAEMTRWALGLGLHTPENVYKIAGAQLALLDVSLFMKAPLLAKILTMDFIVSVAFDDQLVEPGKPFEPYLETLPRVIRDGVLPEKPDQFHLAILDVRNEVIQAGGEAALDQWAHHRHAILAQYMWEHEWRSGGRYFTWEDYLRASFGNGHTEQMFLLMRMEPDSGMLPPGTPLPPELVHLHNLSSLLARFENDMLCYIRDSRDPCVNLFDVLAAEYGVTRHAAVPLAAAAHANTQYEHDALVAAIQEHHPDPLVRSHARAMSHINDCYYAWTLTCPRYSVLNGSTER
ncbi:terpene synthase family protein [Streptomyces bottropensis]|uniref:terpene synthase family protein n=1 Tax=Streptomyces bottropensis TaxID=42235 RepID=UPI0036767FA8